MSLSSSNPIPHTGTLYIRFGPMRSSKSLWLNSELTQLADKGFSVVKIVHVDDIRDDVEHCNESGSTHHSSSSSLTKKIKIIRTSTLSNINVDDFHVVGIDEGQFFPDLYSYVKNIVEIQGKHARVVGLDGDFSKSVFSGEGLSNVLSLIPLSDQAAKLTASCVYCLQDLKSTNFKGNILAIEAPFTKRLGTSMEVKIVGGNDDYIPVCRYHHI